MTAACLPATNYCNVQRLHLFFLSDQPLGGFFHCPEYSQEVATDDLGDVPLRISSGDESHSEARPVGPGKALLLLLIRGRMQVLHALPRAIPGIAVVGADFGILLPRGGTSV